ncbi:hypothetical protein HPP92_015547 [Vanilla planifolia]|uniref:Uncharacterized protein n=1 Tax=Vanilla planifolia TaxID=51239 RepID=A0A835QES0_VANPL|nr:hypothetical protein HPP92_016186 [Vanilla planifolia]KAG0471001.1 hypothetical protein HPP92_015547 [Vanilla planifolia]
MGTLIGHLLPGAAFTLLGLWHLLHTSAAYRLSESSSSFSNGRTWFPSPFLKQAEPALLLLFSILSAVFLLLHPSSPADLEHAAMFFHFAIYSAAALLSIPSSPIVAALAASAFAQELLLLHLHSIDHSRLEGHYHRLMELAVGACLASTIATIACPASHVAAVVRSATVAAQGLWFVISGFVLWGPTWLTPEGCSTTAGGLACSTGGAAATANLQFSGMVAGVSALAATLCLLPERKGVEYRQLVAGGGRCGDGGGVKPDPGQV